MISDIIPVQTTVKPDALFEKLVETEAAVRLGTDTVKRNHVVTLVVGDKIDNCPIDNPDSPTKPKDIGEQLYHTFLNIYDYAFQDSSQHSKIVNGKVCNTRDLSDDSKEELKQVFQNFAETHYDENGALHMPIGQSPPEALRDLYEKIRANASLHNVSLACGQLFVELGGSKKWLKAAPNGIDFTRGEPTEDLKTQFNQAFYDKKHTPPTSPFINLPQSYIELEGVRFPVKIVDNWKTHLVTQTGHLINLTAELKDKIEKHIIAGKPLDELRFPVDEALHISQFQHHLPDNHAARNFIINKLTQMSQAETMDGLPVKDDKGTVRIMSLDEDLLTGLSMAPGRGQNKKSELEQFQDAWGKTKSFADMIPQDFQANILAMREERDRARAVNVLRNYVKKEIGQLEQKAAAEGNGKLVDIIQRAGAHLENTVPFIYQSADKAFLKDNQNPQGPVMVKPRQSPGSKRFYMTMGGGASGKSDLKAIADKECGNTLVVASLDDARLAMDRYWLYAATNNHNDDYKTSALYGNAIRELVTRRALKDSYNLYLDGSGIPYEGRNDATVKKFKKEGYNTAVFAVEAPLYLDDPQKREELGRNGEAPNDALLRAGVRFTSDLRGLIPSVVVDKHVGFALASREAARDKNVDRFMIEDGSGKKDEGTTLSFVRTLSKEETFKLVNLKGKELKDALIEDKIVPRVWVTLPKGDKNEELYNLKVVRDNEDGTYRVEFITDIKKYISLVEKGLRRKDVAGPEALSDNTVKCDIEGMFKGAGGKLNIKPPENYHIARWPNYTYPFGEHTAQIKIG